MESPPRASRGSLCRCALARRSWPRGRRGAEFCKVAAELERERRGWAEWGCAREKPASCELSGEEGGKRLRVPLPERRVGRAGWRGRGTGGTHSLPGRGASGTARDGQRADPQVHPEPAEARTGGRAQAQRRVRRRGGRQPSAAAGECRASLAPRRGLPGDPRQASSLAR